MFQGDRGSPGPVGPVGMKGEGYPGPRVREGDKDLIQTTQKKKTLIRTTQKTKAVISIHVIYSQGLQGLPGLPGEVGPEGQGIPGPKVLVIIMQF